MAAKQSAKGHKSRAEKRQTGRRKAANGQTAVAQGVGDVWLA